MVKVVAVVVVLEELVLVESVLELVLVLTLALLELVSE